MTEFTAVYVGGFTLFLAGMALGAYLRHVGQKNADRYNDQRVFKEQIRQRLLEQPKNTHVCSFCNGVGFAIDVKHHHQEGWLVPATCPACEGNRFVDV